MLFYILTSHKILSRQDILNKCNLNRQLVRLTFKDGSARLGVFEQFGDYEDLKRNDKYRFVCSDREMELNVSLFSKHQADIRFSMIVMVDAIENIELVIPM